MLKILLFSLGLICGILVQRIITPAQETSAVAMEITQQATQKITKTETQLLKEIAALDSKCTPTTNSLFVEGKEFDSDTDSISNTEEFEDENEVIDNNSDSDEIEYIEDEEL